MSATTSLAEVLPPEALADGEAGGSLARAEAVVHPETTEEVAETLRWACANGVGVLPVGSGARAVGPRRDGRFIVLGTARLAGLEIYEPADLTLTAKAGTRLAVVDEALRAHRQWLPFDPPHVTARTLGGLVATGESGPVATGYGELRSHVLGATVVCGDGRTLRLGGRVVKNVAGFDLLRPMVGSRGRLGVITSVCLRAFPVPAEDRLLVFTAGEVAGLADVARAVGTAPILPASSLAWASASSLRAGAALVVRLHGAQATVEAEQAMLERHAGVSFEQPADPAAVLAEARDHAASGLCTLALSLLPSRLFAGLQHVRERLGDVPVAADTYGGFARVGVESADVAAVKGLRSDVERLGGALSVDGPDVESKLPGASSQPTPAEVELATRLERVFDPGGVFWPCRA